MAINEPRMMHKHISTRNESHVQPLNTNFSQQEVDLQKTPLFFPEGFEMIFLGIYFIILPYIAGILFLFFSVAESSPDLFSSIYENSFFMLTWTIGYEILAAIILLYIVKMSLTFANENRKSKPKPSEKRYRRR